MRVIPELRLAAGNAVVQHCLGRTPVDLKGIRAVRSPEGGLVLPKVEARDVLHLVAVVPSHFSKLELLRVVIFSSLQIPRVLQVQRKLHESVLAVRARAPCRSLCPSAYTPTWHSRGAAGKGRHLTSAVRWLVSFGKVLTHLPSM